MKNRRRNGKLPIFLFFFLLWNLSIWNIFTSKGRYPGVELNPSRFSRDSIPGNAGGISRLPSEPIPCGRGSSGSLGTGSKSSGIKAAPSKSPWDRFHGGIPLGRQPRNSTWISLELIPIIQTTGFHLGNALPRNRIPGRSPTLEDLDQLLVGSIPTKPNICSLALPESVFSVQFPASPFPTFHGM